MLRVGVYDGELNAGKSTSDHIVHCVASCTTYSHYCNLGCEMMQIELALVLEICVVSDENTLDRVLTVSIVSR
jgi:hypothetical protein